jgi:hypothetical protein
MRTTKYCIIQQQLQDKNPGTVHSRFMWSYGLILCDFQITHPYKEEKGGGGEVVLVVVVITIHLIMYKG